MLDSGEVDVAAFGENSVDLVARVARWPGPDAKGPYPGLTRQPGGQVATAMVACQRLGLRARYVGAFGADKDGRWVRREIAARGVEVIPLSRPGATRQALIIVDATTGARTVLEHRDRRLNVPARQLPVRRLLQARVVLLDASDPAAALVIARAARAASIPVVLDVDGPVPGLGPLLDATDILIVSASFPRAFTGARRIDTGLAELARRSAARLVVTTQGEAGSVAWHDGRIVRTRALRLRAVDTTGAGDVFRAGFIAAWLRSRGGPPLDVLLRYANAAAGLSTQGEGAWGALPKWAAVRARV